MKHQDLRDLMGLSRSSLASHYRQEVDELADKMRFPHVMAFLLPKNLWAWVTSYLKHAFERKHPFMTYPLVGDRGCYSLVSANGSGRLRISIAGDWGTGTAEADRVAAHIQDLGPDYTIHLGDVYYVGDRSEISKNCLGQSANGYQGVTWRIGTQGSFALNSNHEMYANGDGYFETLIPRLGIPASGDKTQIASFFCLQNDTWRILGLDTGYNSVGVPILGSIPLLNRIPGIGPSYKLENALLEWLRTDVNPARNPRATIVLTHHPYFSAFEAGYTAPAKQLAEFFGHQEVIWIWGHEHRMAVYEKYADGAITAFGRCVGHGGMPVEISRRPRGAAAVPLQYYDARMYTQIGCSKLGFNGFVNIEIRGDVAALEYLDLNNQRTMLEEFRAGGIRLYHRFLEVHPALSKGNAAPQ